ncbi:MAG TPA: hypothetical protein VLB76_08410 [Thermoanaerobaculia bacterium]|nr:hypothetical protein [Thermoanaerobaculia bacterium]
MRGRRSPLPLEAQLRVQAGAGEVGGEVPGEIGGGGVEGGGGLEDGEAARVSRWTSRARKISAISSARARPGGPGGRCQVFRFGG